MIQNTIPNKYIRKLNKKFMLIKIESQICINKGCRLMQVKIILIMDTDGMWSGLFPFI